MNNTLQQQLIERDRALVALKKKVLVAQERVKKFADKKRREVLLKWVIGYSSNFVRIGNIRWPAAL